MYGQFPLFLSLSLSLSLGWLLRARTKIIELARSGGVGKVGCVGTGVWTYAGDFPGEGKGRERRLKRDREKRRGWRETEKRRGLKRDGEAAGAGEWRERAAVGWVWGAGWNENGIRARKLSLAASSVIAELETRASFFARVVSTSVSSIDFFDFIEDVCDDETLVPWYPVVPPFFPVLGLNLSQLSRSRSFFFFFFSRVSSPRSFSRLRIFTRGNSVIRWFQ